MRVSLRGMMLIVTMLCITLALLGRPIYWLSFNEPFSGAFCDSYRHLSWVFGLESGEYYKDTTDPETPERMQFIAGKMLGLFSSAILHIAVMALLIFGWIHAIADVRSK
jgi:ABC-type Na+ efflux pump permease subunit